MSGDERVWLRHPETGGAFQCPTEAVEHWLDLGWETGEAPPEHNPVTAEMQAYREQQAELAAQEQVEQQQAAKATKSGRTSGTDNTPQEG